jgi:hypothetical protein
MTNPPEQKLCPLCRQTLPISRFRAQYTYKGDEKIVRGYYSQCKSCVHKIYKAKEQLERAPLLAFREKQKLDLQVFKDKLIETKQKNRKLKKALAQLKPCYACREFLPRTEEFFPLTPGGSFARICLSCSDKPKTIDTSPRTSL